MKDIIYRQDAIKELESEKDKKAKGDIAVFYNKIIENDIEKLRKLPSAQPEQKRGKWIDYANSHCECSVCHTEWSYFQNEVECFEFCPNCGAKMEVSE